MTINVRSYDLGFYTEEPITVCTYEHGILTYCNHARHYPETLTVDGGLDSERYIRAEICDKCDAWSYDGEEWF